MGSEPFEWREPNEVELREIRERRVRSDLISKIMADYLLKGFRMLSTYCNECGNVLLDDKKGRIFCVGCEEIDKKGQGERQSSNNVAEASTSSTESKHLGLPNQPNDEVTLTVEAKNALLESMKTATLKLNSCQNSFECAEYANQIRCCADALCSLNKLKRTCCD